MALSLEIKTRSLQQTKSQIKATRHEGWIPAIIYGGEKEPQGVSIEVVQFIKELSVSGIYTRVFDLGDLGKVLIKCIQFPPMKDVPIHVDLLRLGAKVVVSVPVKFINEDMSPGIKMGGVLNVIHHTLNISVSSGDIPHELCVDLKGMTIGQAIHLQNLMLPDDVKVLRLKANDSIASIVAPTVLVEPAKEAAKA